MKVKSSGMLHPVDWYIRVTEVSKGRNFGGSYCVQLQGQVRALLELEGEESYLSVCPYIVLPGSVCPYIVLPGSVCRIVLPSSVCRIVVLRFIPEYFWDTLVLAWIDRT